MGRERNRRWVARLWRALVLAPLAPLAGLADAIVDLVSSGSTLRANDLVEVEEVAAISSRLIVNQAALKTKRDELMPLVERLEQAVAQ